MGVWSSGAMAWTEKDGLKRTGVFESLPVATLFADGAGDGNRTALSAWEEFLSHRVSLYCNDIGGLSWPLVTPTCPVVRPVCGPVLQSGLRLGGRRGRRRKIIPRNSPDSYMRVRRRDIPRADRSPCACWPRTGLIWDHPRRDRPRPTSVLRCLARVGAFGEVDGYRLNGRRRRTLKLK